MNRKSGGFALTCARATSVAFGLLLAGASAALADGNAEARFQASGKADPARIKAGRQSRS